MSVKSEAQRLAQVRAVGGDMSSKRSGNVLTVRVSFKTSHEVQTAAFKLRGQGWGVSIDGLKVRALVVVA